MAAPCYLQLIRNGNTFAVYKSSDGIFWAQVHDESGGAFSVTGRSRSASMFPVDELPARLRPLTV